MRDEDVLITEYRVTAIGEGGQYIFDWVDEEANTVQFVPEESDFEDFESDVEKALNRNGVSIVSETNSSNDKAEKQPTNKSEGTTSKNIGQPEPIGGSTDENFAEEDDSSDFKPVDSSTPDQDIDSSNEPNSVDKNESPSSKETFSFIVRMSDPSNRRTVIKKMREDYPSAADELELSGPFEVTYEVQDDSLKLVKVKDLGTGTHIGSK